MTRPTLSVVIPGGVRDSGMGLTLASALASDLEGLELLIVSNDGETLRLPTPAQLRESGVGLRLPVSPNGRADALAVALPAARGEFCTLVPAGAAVQPWLWPAQVAVLRAGHAALVYCDTEVARGRWTDGWPDVDRVDTHAAADWPRLVEQAVLDPPMPMMRTDVWRALRRAGSPATERPADLWDRFRAAGLRGVRIPRAGGVTLASNAEEND